MTVALAPFLAAVEAKLQEFLAAAWPLTDGDEMRWAEAFVEAQRAVGGPGR